MPNAINMNLVYQLIEAEWDIILESSKQLIREITVLCQNTSATLFNRHFSRFTSLLEMLSEQMKQQYL